MEENKNSIAYKRLTSLFDDGVFTEIDPFSKNKDSNTQFIAGFGYVNGCETYAFSQDVETNDGAIDLASCSKILKVYNLATKTGYPIIAIYDSNGVKLTEGFEILNAYGEIIKASASVSGVVPQVSIIAGACLGSCALMANMADIVVATKDADFYVNAPSEITTECSSKEGTVDVLANNFDDAVENVKKIISLLPSNNISPSPIYDFSSTGMCSDNMNATDLISNIADDDSVVELKAEYAKSNCITALATVAGSTVGFVAFDGNSLCPSCSYKAEAMIKFCDAFSIPIITIADAAGIITEKENQLLVALTKLFSAYSSATTAKISLITRESIGAAYIILAGKGANADLTFAFNNAVASPLDVDSAVAFLYNQRLANGEDRSILANEYKQSVGSVFTAAACGSIDDVFSADQTRNKIIAALEMLSSKRELTISRKHSVK